MQPTHVCVYTDVFKLDPDFLENEEKYKTIKRGKKTSHCVPSIKYYFTNQSVVASVRHPG